MLGYAVLSRCFCSVTQTLRLRGVYVWMRFRGVCVWLCCAFVAVFVFGYAALLWWLDALCFRGVFVGARCAFAVCSGPMATLPAYALSPSEILLEM